MTYEQRRDRQRRIVRLATVDRDRSVTKERKIQQDLTTNQLIRENRERNLSLDIARQ